MPTYVGFVRQITCCQMLYTKNILLLGSPGICIDGELRALYSTVMLYIYGENELMEMVIYFLNENNS